MNPEPELQPGELILGGKYRVVAFEGQGACAQVYRVRYADLEVERAVKVVSRHMIGVGSTALDDFRRRFKQEAELGLNLRHPHVIHIDDAEEADERLYLIMEYAAGGSLARRLRSGLLPVDEAVRIVLEAAAGLQALHRMGAVHRDVKPSNILLDREGVTKISDLGLAQVRSGISRRSELGSAATIHPGTPEYMSPEQARTVEYLGASSDVYSLGCVFFELLTGQLWREAMADVEHVRELREEVPQAIEAVLERMLREQPGRKKSDETNPALRYVTMAPLRSELAAALEGVLAEETARACERAEAETGRLQEEERAARHSAETEAGNRQAEEAEGPELYQWAMKLDRAPAGAESRSPSKSGGGDAPRSSRGIAKPAAPPPVPIQMRPRLTAEAPPMAIVGVVLLVVVVVLLIGAVILMSTKPPATTGTATFVPPSEAVTLELPSTRASASWVTGSPTPTPPFVPTALPATPILPTATQSSGLGGMTWPIEFNGRTHNQETQLWSPAEGIDRLPPGSSFQALGRTFNDEYLLVRLPDGNSGWLLTTDVDLGVRLIDIPVASIPSDPGLSPRAVSTPDAAALPRSPELRAVSSGGPKAVLREPQALLRSGKTSTMLPTGANLVLLGRTYDDRHLLVMSSDGLSGWIDCSAASISVPITDIPVASRP